MQTLQEKYFHQISTDYKMTATQKGFFDAYLSQAFGNYQRPLAEPAVVCFVNAQSRTFAKERNNIAGEIQFAPIVVRKQKHGNGWRVSEQVPAGFDTVDITNSCLFFDSGAFPELRINRRITPRQSLARQLKQLSKLKKQPAKIWLVSYDRLIKKKLINSSGCKTNCWNSDYYFNTWDSNMASLAVDQTVEATEYLHSQRKSLQDYTLVQSCQGIDAQQYQLCVEKVLQFCLPGDVLGLGGWCFLGKQKHWLPSFWETINRVVPIIANAGITKIHIFGCTWWKKLQGFSHTPLGSLLWLCDQHGISLSCDGRSPISNALWKQESGNCTKRAGALHPYWRVNLALVRTMLATLRDRPEYQAPPKIRLLGAYRP